MSEYVQDEFNDDEGIYSDETVAAILNADEFIDDYNDELFGNVVLSLDSERSPYGWDIADHFDWDSLDYE